MIPRTAPVHPTSFLLVTLDSCRYDTMEAADAPNIRSVGPLHRAYAPGSLTYTSHTAMFMGFTPGVPSVREPFTNPKWTRVFRVRGGGSAGHSQPLAELQGRNVIDGLKRLGYVAIGTGSVRWFDPDVPSSQNLTRDFDRFFYPGDTWSLDRQLAFLDRELNEATQPVFAFLNVGETHVPYFHVGAPWSREINPCRPFGTDNDAGECRRRQLACLEWVDRRIGPLLERFREANTMVCADHGDAWGEDGLWEHGIHHPTVLEVPLVHRLQNAAAAPDSIALQSRAVADTVSIGVRRLVRQARTRLEALGRSSVIV
jgi:Sulfatase